MFQAGFAKLPRRRLDQVNSGPEVALGSRSFGKGTLIDISTLILVTVVVSATLSIVLFLFADHSGRDGLAFWGVSAGLYSAAYGLFLLRGSASDLLSVVAANILLAASLAFALEALARFFGKGPSRWLIWLPVPVMGVGMFWLGEQFEPRVMLNAALLWLQVLMMTILVVRHWQGTPGRGRYLLLVSLVVVLILLAARLLGTALGGLGAGSLFESSHLQTLTFLTAMLFQLLLALAVIVMARERMEEELRRNEQRFRTLVEDANDVIYTLDLNGIFRYLSPNLREILGLEPKDVVGQHFATIVHVDDLPGCEAFLQRLLSTRTKQSGLEYRVRHGDGGWRWHVTNASPLLDANGALSGMIGIGHDVSERKLVEDQTHRLAHYDALTELPNRGLFFERLQQAMREAERKDGQLAVMFLDLDRFKPINDSHGHAVGDRVLQTLAERLRACLRDADTIGRIGGDEFLILLPEVGSARDACVVAEKLVRRVQTPLNIAGLHLEISCSIGVALYPAHGHDGTMLIRHADEAMYEAKRAGRDQVRLFNADRVS
ncbi:diguanylate cyclase domain-containing protein [Lamprobacter modestohalophilus]|uniref:diguanylate cyclase domain-containing protein n=1 Tax=Lamprobacter modestohalophilus TaxID=1064514 RepID=UPI002ADEAE7B|nr:diguanylate cyclase [Lamprobacter modestohalophilus]